MAGDQSDAMPSEEFDRGHLQLLNQKLLQKVEELEAVNHERTRLLADLVKAQEIERSRIAADIHDDSIQVMSAAALRLEMLGYELDEPKQREALEAVAGKVSEAVRRLRRLIFDLSPRSVESGGLGPAIEAYAREVAGQAGFEWKLEDEVAEPLSDEIEVVVYRIAQEAIRNVQKHAQARQVCLTLSRRDGGTALRIVDDGVGFDAAGSQHRPGHVGLPSMRERAELTGGAFRIDSEPGAGCVVEVWVPDAAPRREGSADCPSDRAGLAASGAD